MHWVLFDCIGVALAATIGARRIEHWVILRFETWRPGPAIWFVPWGVDRFGELRVFCRFGYVA